MLFQAEKERVLLEEKHRIEVRKQLERDEGGRWEHLWPILNGAFTLWLLSTVFVGVIT